MQEVKYLNAKWVINVWCLTANISELIQKVVPPHCKCTYNAYVIEIKLYEVTHVYSRSIKTGFESKSVILKAVHV